jgi:hypothetical protein
MPRSSQLGLKEGLLPRLIAVLPPREQFRNLAAAKSQKPADPNSLNRTRQDRSVNNRPGRVGISTDTSRGLSRTPNTQDPSTPQDVRLRRLWHCKMLIGYDEARSSVDTSANFQPSARARRFRWLNAIVGPSPGRVDAAKSLAAVRRSAER